MKKVLILSLLLLSACAGTKVKETYEPGMYICIVSTGQVVPVLATSVEDAKLEMEHVYERLKKVGLLEKKLETVMCKKISDELPNDSN